MEEQRKRVRSCNPAERLAAALVISAELSRRLRLLGNSHIAQLHVLFTAVPHLSVARRERISQLTLAISRYKFRQQETRLIGLGRPALAP